MLFSKAQNIRFWAQGSFKIIAKKAFHYQNLIPTVLNALPHFFG